MTRKSAIETVWRLTLASFAFAQIIGIVVVISLVASEEQVSSIQVVAAYALFFCLVLLCFSPRDPSFDGLCLSIRPPITIRP